MFEKHGRPGAFLASSKDKGGESEDRTVRKMSRSRERRALVSTRALRKFGRERGLSKFWTGCSETVTKSADLKSFLSAHVLST